MTRASVPQPAPLKFKDDIFVQDRVTAGKDSAARILLGGRAVVTVREHSTVTITEAPGVATVDVAAGRVAVAVAREKMRAGDRIEVRTPNAIAGIRGTVIVAEVFGPTHSVVTVLKGTIDVTRLETGRLVGAVTIVNALERVIIAGRAPVSAPQPIAPAAAQQLGQEFRLGPPRVVPPAVTAAVNANEVGRATNDLATRAPWNPVDRDAEGLVHEGRGIIGRENLDTVGRLEPAAKGDPAPPVKSYGRAADAINAVGEAMKGDRNGRRNRDRDRY